MPGSGTLFKKADFEYNPDISDHSCGILRTYKPGEAVDYDDLWNLQSDERRTKIIPSSSIDTLIRFFHKNGPGRSLYRSRSEFINKFALTNFLVVADDRVPGFNDIVFNKKDPCMYSFLQPLVCDLQASTFNVGQGISETCPEYKMHRFWRRLLELYACGTPFTYGKYNGIVTDFHDFNVVDYIFRQATNVDYEHVYNNLKKHTGDSSLSCRQTHFPTNKQAAALFNELDLELAVMAFLKCNEPACVSAKTATKIKSCMPSDLEHVIKLTPNTLYCNSLQSIESKIAGKKFEFVRCGTHKHSSALWFPTAAAFVFTAIFLHLSAIKTAFCDFKRSYCVKKKIMNNDQQTNCS